MLKPICHPLLEHGRREGGKGLLTLALRIVRNQGAGTDQEQIRDENVSEFQQKMPVLC